MTYKKCIATILKWNMHCVEFQISIRKSQKFQQKN